MTKGNDPLESELLPLFIDRASELGVVVSRLENGHAVADAIASQASELGVPSPLVAAELIAAAPDLDRLLREREVIWSVPDDPARARDAQLGISFGQAAIAETGSVLLAEGSLNDRAIGMLVRVQIIVCRTETLVPSLDQAAPLLRALALRAGGAYTTLVTGPSRTADIERVLTVGVQGPGRVVVFFVDNLT